MIYMDSEIKFSLSSIHNPNKTIHSICILSYQKAVPSPQHYCPRLEELLDRNDTDLCSHKKKFKTKIYRDEEQDPI